MIFLRVIGFMLKTARPRPQLLRNQRPTPLFLHSHLTLLPTGKATSGLPKARSDNVDTVPLMVVRFVLRG